MNFTLYRELLAIRPIRRLLVVGMIARIPHSAAGVLLTLHIVLTLGQGYAAAGTAAAVMTIGIAVGAPRGAAAGWTPRDSGQPSSRRWFPRPSSGPIVPHVSYRVAAAAGLCGRAVDSAHLQRGAPIAGRAGRRRPAQDRLRPRRHHHRGGLHDRARCRSECGHEQVIRSLGLDDRRCGLSTSLAGLFLMSFNPPTRSEAPDGGTTPSMKRTSRRRRGRGGGRRPGPRPGGGRGARLPWPPAEQTPHRAPAQGRPQFQLVHRGRCGGVYGRGRGGNGAQRHGPPRDTCSPTSRRP